MERLKRIIKRLIDLISREEMRILPGHIAFFLVLSLVPIITLVGYIASFFHVSLQIYAFVPGSDIDRRRFL